MTEATSVPGISTSPATHRVGSAIAAAASDWSKHRTARLGAALAYYSVFSLGPLLLVLAAIAGLFFGQEAARGALTEQMQDLLGETGGRAVEAMLAAASAPASGWLAGICGLVLLLFGALSIVVQLKDALNTIWEVEEPPSAGVGWYVRTYLSALAIVLALGVLVALSLVATAGLSAFSNLFGGAFSPFWEVGNFTVSVGLLGLLFGVIFKWFPDTSVAWRDVRLAALLTAVFFTVGKFAIGWYIGAQGLESAYGTAASVVVFLLWLYYSAQIVLFGAELAHSRAKLRLSALPK